MKQIAKILLGIYLLIGVLFSVIGFAWQTVLGNAGTNLHYDHVYQVKYAYIDEDEELYVCVDGKYSENKRQYWIRVPVDTIEKAPETLDQVNGYAGYWKESLHQQWHLPRKNIVVADCLNRPSVEKRTVSIKTLDAGMTGSIDTEDKVNADFDNTAENELVYQLNVTDGAGKSINKKDLAYANRQSIFKDKYDEKHVFMFETNYYRQRGSQSWYLVLPFAWALDVIAWPIELAMWVEYAGAH